MYQHEADSATKTLCEILEVDINTLDKVKYDNVVEFLRTLTTVHYSKGHDDGYGMCAGYSLK